MKHEEQVRQIKVMLDRIDSGTTVDAGGFLANPMSVYTDEDLAAEEWAEFFRGQAHLIGLSGDLAEQGSFLTMDDLGTPILATRTDGGEFKAFVNACRHRGVTVETRPSGTARRFTCPFHSWSYSNEGALVGIPKTDHFGDIDPSCHGLIELPALEHAGLLFVHPQPGGIIGLHALLGKELLAELENWNFGLLEHLGGDTYEVDWNWKLAMDTFGETYHFESLHRDTLAMNFRGNVQCYDTFGRNHRMLLCKRAIDHIRHLPEDEWDIAEATLPVYYLFPSVQLMPSDGVLFLVRAYPDPTNPGRHVSRITFYAWPHRGEMVGADHREMLSMVGHGFANIIRDEDYVASASQQRTAESGAMDYALFGRNEPALHHYHNTYRQALGRDRLPLLPEAPTS